MRTLKILLLTLLVLCLSCAPSRYTVLSLDPNFDRKSIKASQIAFLLPDEVDINSVLYEMADKFGKPEEAELLILGTLRECLTGKRKVTKPGSSPSQKIKIECSVIDSSILKLYFDAQNIYDEDKYGFKTPVIEKADTLSSLLLYSGYEYLVIMSSLELSKETIKETRPGLIADADLSFPSQLVLTGKFSIWGARSKKLFYKGLVRSSGGLVSPSRRSLIEYFAFNLIIREIGISH